MLGMDPGVLGTEAGVVSSAHREKIDVWKALTDAQEINDDERLAKELVGVAIDADSKSIVPLLESIHRITDEGWRARTTFSVPRTISSRVASNLPKHAQTELVAL